MNIGKNYRKAINEIKMQGRGILGQVVRAVDLESLLDSNPVKDLQNISGPTHVPARARRGTLGLPSPVKAGNRHITISVSIQSTKNKTKQMQGL